MADLKEYYKQISDINKAIRERELYRLELEKQRLMKTHKREKRQEEFRDRIKELHKELVREELEATRRFESLLAEVESVKREYQLLNAQTERLRQKKRQYEIKLAASNADHRFIIPDDQYPSFLGSVGATSGIMPQAASTPILKLPVSQQAFSSQPLVSPVMPTFASTSQLWPKQPQGYYVSEGQVKCQASGQQSLNSTGMHTGLPSSQVGVANSMTNLQPHKVTEFKIPSVWTNETPQSFPQSVQFSNVKTLDPEAHSTSAPSYSEQPGELLQGSLSTSGVSSFYNAVYNLKDTVALHTVGEDAPSTIGATSQQAQHFFDHQSQQEPLRTESVQKPNIMPHNVQISNELDHMHVQDNQIPPVSKTLAVGVSVPPGVTTINSALESVRISETSSQSANTIDQFSLHHHESPMHIIPSASKVIKGTVHESVVEEEGTRYARMSSVPETDQGKDMSSPSSEENVQYIPVNTVSSHEGATNKKFTSDAIKDQPILHSPSSVPVHNSLKSTERCKEKKDANLDAVLVTDRNNCRVNQTEETQSPLASKFTIKYSNESDKNNSHELNNSEKKSVFQDSHGADSDSVVYNDIVHENPSISSVVSEAENSLPVRDENATSVDNVTGNNVEAYSPQMKHIDAVSNTPMKCTVKETEVSGLQSPTISDEDGNNKLEGEMVKSSRQSPESASSGSVVRSPEKLVDQSSDIGRKMSATESIASKPLQSDSQLQELGEDSDVDFFDRKVSVTASAAYKSLVGSAGVGAGTLNSTESESDDIEGQLSTVVSRQETQATKSPFKPFASSIPSLRPLPPGTDTDSVDSVEAAIQASLQNKRKDQPSPSNSPTRSQRSHHSPSTTKNEALSHKDTIKPGVGLSHNKPHTSGALQLKLDSDSESYGVSAGDEGSDEDDFDFYDKF